MKLRTIVVACGSFALLWLGSVGGAEKSARKPLLTKASYTVTARSPVRAPAPAPKSAAVPKPATPAVLLHREDVTLEEMQRYHQ